jgi:hypothetical protein
VATDRTPIPPDAFAAAIDRLDRDALAAFVGRLEAAADEATEVVVDPPVVGVSDGNGRRRILVAPDGADIDTDGSDPSPDSVVIGPGESIPTEHDVPVRTAEDLRHQLLYAVSPESAASIAEEWLDVPARSASYTPEPTPTATSGRDADAGRPRVNRPMRDQLTQNRPTPNRPNRLPDWRADGERPQRRTARRGPARRRPRVAPGWSSSGLAW